MATDPTDADALAAHRATTARHLLTVAREAAEDGLPVALVVLEGETTRTLVQGCTNDPAEILRGIDALARGVSALRAEVAARVGAPQADTRELLPFDPATEGYSPAEGVVEADPESPIPGTVEETMAEPTGPREIDWHAPKEE